MPFKKPSWLDKTGNWLSPIRMKINQRTQKTALDNDLPILPPVVLALRPIPVRLIAPATIIAAILEMPYPMIIVSKATTGPTAPAGKNPRC